MGKKSLPAIEKGLITRIYRELTSPRINDPMKKCVDELNKMKKCSTSLPIKEMQIKTTLRFHITPVRMAIIKNTNNNKCWRGCKGKKEPSYTVDGNIN
jgi:hypothetical protein